MYERILSDGRLSAAVQSPQREVRLRSQARSLDILLNERPAHPNANVGKNHQHVRKMTKGMKGWGRGENKSRPKGTRVATERLGINEGGHEKQRKS